MSADRDILQTLSELLEQDPSTQSNLPVTQDPTVYERQDAPPDASICTPTASEHQDAQPDASMLTPISIHIPASLSRYATPLSQFKSEHPKYDVLIVGACIFARSGPSKTANNVISEPARTENLTTSGDQSSKNNSPEPRLLIIQRSLLEFAMPTKWEVPGGGVDDTDPTILHGLAREVFEEAGLHLTRVVDLVAIDEFGGRRGQYCKWTFEIEVAEIPSRFPQDPSSMETGGRQLDLKEIPVVLDPREHQAYRWVTKDEVENYAMTTIDQKNMIYKSFDVHNSSLSHL
jgi:8-oxo-dGTP pyrophosphatase MutT (NUDIX family)